MPETTPIYAELVVKYYLSKGIKPFSYPHEPVDTLVIPKPKIRVADLNGATVGQYIDLMTKAHQYSIPETDTDGRPHIKYEYFRL